MKDILMTAFAPLVWGTTYLVVAEFMPEGRPLLAAAIRALPAGLVMLLIFRQLPRGIWWLRSFVLGTLNIGAFFWLLFVAAYRLPGGVVAVLGGMQPLAAALLAWVFLSERPTRLRVIASVAGIVGVALVVIGPTVQLDTLGILAGLAATLCMAVGTVLTRMWRRPVSLPVFTAWQLSAGGVVLLVAALAFEGPLPAFTGSNLVAAAYLCTVSTAMAYMLWFRGVERMGTAASYLLLLSPVVAAAVGFLVLGQTLTAIQLAGAALVLSSVSMGQASVRSASH